MNRLASGVAALLLASASACAQKAQDAVTDTATCARFCEALGACGVPAESCQQSCAVQDDAMPAACRGLFGQLRHCVASQKVRCGGSVDPACDGDACALAACVSCNGCAVYCDADTCAGGPATAYCEKP